MSFSFILFQVDSVPRGTQTETASETIHPHLNDNEILKIAQEPNVVKMAAQLLDTEKVSIFTTRILCKMPYVGEAIPWHQDSMYWPLEPLKVVSFWLALDDVNQGYDH